MSAIDQIALDTVQAIAEIDPDKLKGGKVQAMAQAQCLVIDAIEQATRAQGGDVEPVEFLIWSNEHNAYWRPRSAGYTRVISEAGRYTQAEADKICKNASPRAGSELDETVPPEMMMVAPECIGKTHPASTGGTVVEEKIDRGRFWPKLESFVSDYIEGYELRGDDGDYSPNEKEQFLIEDCVAGLLHEMDSEGYLVTASTPYPSTTGGVPDEAKAIIDHVVAELETGFVACERCGDQEDTATLDCMSDLRRLKAMLTATPTPPGADWVRCEDRLPTMKDADHYGQVIGWDADNRESVIGPPCDFRSAPWLTHWMPTGLTENPAPTEGE